MIKKTGLWRGLLFVFTILLAVFIAAALVMEAFRFQIDDFLGTRSQVIETTDDGTLWTAFTPDEDVLNDDGTTNTDKLIQKFIDFGRKQAAGGAVLLKNKEDASGNTVLPLASGSDVTLLGMRSHVMLQGAGFGMPIRGPVITFEEALSESRTDFTNPDNKASSDRNDYSTMSDFDFEGAGYHLNQTMVTAYDTLHGQEKYSSLTPTGPRQNANFDPLEPSLAEVTEAAGGESAMTASFGEYGDAAIVVVGRPSGESSDYRPGGVARDDAGNSTTGAEEPLELTTNEKDMIELAKDNFDKVIVLVNTTSAMEIDELAEDDDIDSILWIGHPGNYGTLGVADILTGKANPSGGLADIYAAKGMSHPAMMNMGDYKYANGDAITRTIRSGGQSKYVVEPEGIYVGYRYYETRYNDIIENRGNADSTAGAVASSGNWNYTDEVTYGFGYGMSYTTFDYELVSATPVIDRANHTFMIDFKVKVTNTGTRDGAANIQIYGQAPYKTGGLEKSAIQLLNYDKTDVIKPGAANAVTMTIRVDMQNIASYDMNHDNGDDTKGTYILDEGDYYFAIGNGAHDALNNVLAKQGRTVANTSGKMDYDGDADVVYELSYDYNRDGDTDDVDDDLFAVTKAKTRVSNHLEYADWNYYEPGKVEHFSRSDWSGTYPVEYANLTAPASMMDHLNGKYYTIKTDDDTSDIKFGVDNGMNFADLAFFEFDDPAWNDLLDQISLEDAMGIIACCGNNFRDMPSIGFTTASLTENSGNGVDLQLFQYRVDGAPWQVDEDDNNANYELEVFGCGPLVASSFDPDLQRELGEMVGLQAVIVSLPILWGPGLNTHRHPYNGRNGDYYSEDPVLCGVIAMEFSMGALDYGLIAAPKHFAFNDQETNRNGIAPFMTEQRAREVELRAFQIAVEATKYDEIEGKDVGMLGLMCSFSKIGAVECTASRGLMTDILQNEWGFHGYAVTDISDDFDIYTAVAYAGTTGYDVRAGYTPSGFDRYQSMADGVTPSPELYEGDAELLTSIKRAAKNVLWAFCQSNLMNGYNSTSHAVWNMTWWRGLYIAAIIVFGVLAAGSLAMYVISEVKKKEEK